MSRPNQSQYLVFSLTALGIAIAAIGMLIYDQSNLTAVIDQQSEEIAALQAEVDKSKEFNNTQLNRLNQMSGNQKELGEFISELQSEISNLNGKYQQTKETARLSANGLQQAQQTIEVLKQELTNTEQQLRISQQTILNQQRALKSQANPELKNAQLTQVVTEFSKTLVTLANDVSVTQTANGTANINLPLNRIFDPGTLNLTAEARPILTTIAESLREFNSLSVEVIGHSDARPIVSILSEKYPTNWELSSVRASKVVNYFVELGIAEQRLTASGKAANEPVRISDSVEDLAVNRRIEIILN